MSGTTTTASTAIATIQRQVVPLGLSYPAYKHYLRSDFLYSCAYCTTAESEGQGIRFLIDHYEPKSVRPELADDYGNLLWACDQCNIYKGDISPPPEARTKGFRFFRPDWDVYGEHFVRIGDQLGNRTNIGYFSIEYLELNRQALRRLRQLRSRLTKCDEFIAHGVTALRRFHIDQLPRHVKAQAAQAIKRTISFSEEAANDIDMTLRQFASSPFLDEDEDAKRRLEIRKRSWKQLQGLYPGVWRAPRTKPKK